MEWKILQLAKSNILKQISARQGAISGAKQAISQGINGVNTITLANIPPLTTSHHINSGMVNIDWDNTFTNTNNVKKYEVFETSEDILALSVTWHRLRPTLSHNINIVSNPSSRPTKLTDEILFKEMIQEDRERANLIRDYYSKKLVVMTLRGQRISKYRKDLNTFIHGDSKVVKEEMMPLIYRLPEFYDYDTAADDMFRSLDTRFEDSRIAAETVKTVYPLKKFIVNRKSGKYNEYWLRDEQNRPCRIEIEHSNQLMHLWDYFFEKNSLTLDSISKFEERDNIAFYKLIKWTIKH